MKSSVLALILCTISLFVFQFVLPGIASSATGTLQVVRVTPDGDQVLDLRQIVVEFNKPMASLGEKFESNDKVAVTITPKLSCQWRWLTDSSLSCDLDDKNAMMLATHYRVVVQEGFSSKDGSRLAGSFEHDFTTQLPSVEYAYIEQWKAPQRPLFRLWTNQPVLKQSLENSLVIANRGSGVRVSGVLLHEVENANAREWLLEPNGELPKDSELTIQLNPGLQSKLGSEKSQESRSVYDFDSFGDFAFVGLQCTTITNTQLLITAANQKENNERCSPQSPISLLFNSPIARGEIAQFLSFHPQLPEINKWKLDELNYDEIYQLKSNHKREEYYRITLPSLRPYTSYTAELKADMNSGPTDMFGRKMSSDAVIEFATDHLRPNLSIPYSHAVLEKYVDSDINMRITNLQSWEFHYLGMNASSTFKNRVHHEAAPLGIDKPTLVPLKIREKLHNRSGVIFGVLKTDPVLNQEYPQEISLFAQVTPYQVHVKLGHFTSLVWVTDLKTGDVVEGAKVQIYKGTLRELASSKTMAQGTTNANGIAILAGASELDPSLSLIYGYKPDRELLFVRVDKGDDMALVPLDYDYEVSVWRASNGNVGDYLRQKDGHVVTFGTTAQGVYRLGDKVQFKIYVRAQNNETLTRPETEWYVLRVNDPMGKTIYEVQNIKLSQFGSFHGEFVVPKSGVVGWYDFELTNKKDVATVYQPMRVLVSDFTPAPFKVSQDLSGDGFFAGDTVRVRTSAKLHSGGGFSKASGRVIASIESRYFSPNTKLTEGFEFSSHENDERFKEVHQTDLVLDQNGEAETSFLLPDLKIYFGTLKVESSVMDDRGKSIAAQNQLTYASVDRFVGLKQTEWNASSKKPVSFQYLVVDTKGNPVRGTKVSILLEREKKSISKIKDVGTTYSTLVTTAFEKYGSCEGTSSLEADVCVFDIKRSGMFRLTAKIKDSKNKEHMTKMSFWVSGDEPIVWDEKNGEFLEIESEKKDYVVGDVARFMVKNPYGNAKALISVERYGVIDSFVKDFSKSAEVIEIPIKEAYLPGFYLSIIIQSERVEKAKAVGSIDLGKPTFSMGYLQVPVIDRYKELTVSARVEHEIYRPKDKVRVTLNAAPKTATKRKEPIELAVIVLDESVLDLLVNGEEQFDPYKGLYKFESLDLRNYSLLTRLVGRQNLEAKGANPGGGGGVDVAMRSVFKYVGYFNPSIIVEPSKSSVIEFEAPDNLTGWRVIVMAVTPTDRAGFGVAQFKVNRPTEIRPAMPNQVMEGDQFNADFTVMNRTDKKRAIAVEIVAEGDVDGGLKTTLTKQFNLAPYEREKVSLLVKANQLKVSRNITQGEIRFRVKAGDELDRDGVLHAIPVYKKRTIESAAFYRSTIVEHANENVIVPKDVFTDIGSLDVSLSPSVISSIEGAFTFMKYYPHGCLEQKLSRAIMAQSYQTLKPYFESSFSWPKSENIPQQVLDETAEFQAPNGGMCYFGASDAHVDPYLSAYTALAFQWMRQSQKSIPVAVESKLLSYLDNFLRRNTSPEHYSADMTTSVRATALFALSLKGKTTLSDLTRMNGQFDKMNLLAQSHFIEAALNTQGASDLAKGLMDKMLKRKTETGGKILFSDPKSDGFERILSSPLRNNCAALSALVSFAKTNGVDSMSDIGFKLVRSISETRKSKSHFENTQENMFCVRALADYSKVYESGQTKLNVSVKLNDQKPLKAKFDSATQKAVVLSHPLSQEMLGQKAAIQIERKGEGRLYYTTILSTSSSKKDAGSVHAGIDVKREYSVLRAGKWTTLVSPMVIQRGDVVKVDLMLSVGRNSNFVVLVDPIPGGLETINQDLATASTFDQNAISQYSEGSKFSGIEYREFGSSYFGFYHRELLHNAARFYSDYLPAGNYRLSYTAQAIAEGEFNALGPKAEEMYNPDVFGRDKASTLKIVAKP